MHFINYYVFRDEDYYKNGKTKATLLKSSLPQTPSTLMNTDIPAYLDLQITRGTKYL